MCAAVVAVATAAIVVMGGAPPGLAVVAVALLCPIVMGGAMWLLMRSTPSPLPPLHEKRQRVRELQP